MFNPTKTKTVVAAFAAAVALSGCGSSDDEAAPAPAASAGTSASAATSPSGAASGVDTETAAWAKEFCAAVNANSKTLTPPTVEASTPDGTRKSLTAFFQSLVDQETGQLKALAKLDPPPGGSDAAAALSKAEKKLKTTRSGVKKVIDNIEANKGDSPAAVKSLVADLGKQMAKLGSYQGIINDLATSKELGPAITAEPSCAVTAG